MYPWCGWQGACVCILLVTLNAVCVLLLSTPPPHPITPPALCPHCHWFLSAVLHMYRFCSVVRFSNEQELHSVIMPLSDEGPGPFEHIFIEV